ncbi:universal stress protein [Parvularcula sp. ZS-1/3]|uniref:Universal stress protein n=1 Tax=Parvularcula mediterranea TaxID=2732508 RepID=A0A7Y3W4D5_9PROT|nr:universal stress protein [Parvularcula mediterranea]NNU15353.1 universal stress protein [Parvularcula mediterranea]
MTFRSLFIPAIDAKSLAGAVSDAGHLLAGRGVLKAQFTWSDYSPPANMAAAVDLSALAEQQRIGIKRMERELRDSFEASAKDLTAAINAEFLSVCGDFPGSMARSSRMCEAILFRHRGKDKQVGDPATIEEILFHSGRPLFLTPESGIAQTPRSFAVAWNGSKEAARALALAQTMIEGAEKVTFITIGEERDDTPSAEVMAAHLSACGTPADVIRRGPAGKTELVLAETAGEAGADALIVGAYSKSRLREIFLGGVTRAMLESPPLPLFIAH